MVKKSSPLCLVLGKKATNFDLVCNKEVCNLLSHWNKPYHHLQNITASRIRTFDGVRPCKKDPKISVDSPLCSGLPITRERCYDMSSGVTVDTTHFWGIWRPNFRDYGGRGEGGRGEGGRGGGVLSWPILTVIRQTGRKGGWSAHLFLLQIPGNNL